MTIAATPKTALITGICTAVVAYFFGPYVDHSEGLVGSVLLIVGALAVAVPAYFLVFGLSGHQLDGFWVANPALLKRLGAWFLGAASTAAVFSLLHYAT